MKAGGENVTCWNLLALNFFLENTRIRNNPSFALCVKPEPTCLTMTTFAEQRPVTSSHLRCPPCPFGMKCRGERRSRGRRGARGERGATGATGATGARGPRGPAGASALTSGAILLFSSGAGGLALSSLGDGTVGQAGVIGADGSTIVSTSFGDQIFMPGPPNHAPLLPRTITVTTIRAYFEITTPTTIPAGSETTVRAQIWTSSAPDATFTPVGSPVLLAPTLTGGISAGDVLTGTSGPISLTIPDNSRIVMVFTITTTSTGPISAVDVEGTASAGLVYV